jgi:flagellar protein FlgJ
MLEPIISGQVAAKSQKEVSLPRLKKSCAEFESIFLNYMFQSMSTATAGEGLLGNSNESKIIKSMFYENLAVGIAKSGGIGLGKILFEELDNQ